MSHPLHNELATFAGGCFWCVQHDFDHVKGVLTTTVGYTGGRQKDPSYEQVCSGSTGHTEAIQIAFDPQTISYPELLHSFLHMIEPKRADGQFCDIGSQYRPVIFYHSDAQRQAALEALRELETAMGPISVDVLAASPFYPAEGYHQKFYQKQTEHYDRYRRGSGRERRLKDIWGNL
jgi:peptide-methionine (S)-S-oxide reductase